MKILLTSHRFWPAIGGTEEAVGRLAAELAKMGHEVTVATSDEPGAPAEEMREGYHIRRFTLRRLGKYRFPPRSYIEFVLSPEWDVVHLHGQRVWSSDYLYRHLARAPAPVVFTAYGFYQRHVERTPLLDDVYYGRVLPRALRHATPTASTSPELEELANWGVPRERTRVVPVGIEAADFENLPEGFRARYGIPVDEPLLLYVGGFYPNKRVDRLVEVAAKTDATLAVVGREGHAHYGLEHCRTLAQRLGAKTRFLGPLPRDEILSAYREADLFVLASDFEGFGIVLLEAMASGLPFVSTPAGAAPDLASHGGGTIAQPDMLAQEVLKLLRDPGARRRMGEKGREAAASVYPWRKVASQYLELYEEVQRR